VWLLRHRSPAETLTHGWTEGNGFLHCSVETRGLADVLPAITTGEYLRVFWEALVAAAEGPCRGSYALELGGAYSQAGLSVRAIGSLSSLLRQRPRDPSAHGLLGLSHLRQGNTEASLKPLEAALTMLRREATADGSLDGVLRGEPQSGRPPPRPPAPVCEIW
jgi:hypothetical protein